MILYRESLSVKKRSEDDWQVKVYTHMSPRTGRYMNMFTKKDMLTDTVPICIPILMRIQKRY